MRGRPLRSRRLPGGWACGLLLGACSAEAAISGPVATVAVGEGPELPLASRAAPAGAAAAGAPAAEAPAAEAPAPTPPRPAPSPVPPTPAPEPVAPPAVEPVTEGCVASLDELHDGAALLPVDDRRRRHGTLVVVRKAQRRLLVFVDGDATHCFPVALGFAPAGHKQVQGDGKTPEGLYRTSDKPWSSFEHAIAIHYPNADDARAAASDGRISSKTRDRILADVREGRVPPQSTKLGGAVLIHGGGASSDWTLGCVALEDADLLTLRSALPRGMRTDLLVLP